MGTVLDYSLGSPTARWRRAATMDDPPEESLSRETRLDAIAKGNDGDVQLMTLVAKGDDKAFERLVERHQHAVIGTVAKMIGNVSDAHDLSQQVFLRVWKSAPKYKPSAKFTTWLFTITRNLVFNECRRRYRHREVSMEEHEENTHTTVADQFPERPDEAALQQELETAVDRAIAELPETQRMAVVLRRFEEMPYEQIAEVLDLSLPAVKSLLFRARNQLKVSLRRYLDGDT